MVIKQKVDRIMDYILSRVKSLKTINKSLANTTSLVQAKSLMLVYVALIILFTTGIVNALVEGARLNTQLPVIPGYQAQTLAEVVIFSSTTIFGVLGFTLMARGTRQVKKGRTTVAFIVSGLGLVLFGLIIGFYIFALKGSQ
jgi:hypothetical protein|tara:strand:- start:2075 stop:2500 length:426 start_codon:yes stop_codon:yes gene_type:complete